MKTTTRKLLTLSSLIAAVFASAAVIAQPGPGSTQPASMQGRALERFQTADTDKDGTLSKDEASKGMPGLGERFAALDTNQDGKITAEEFQTFRNNMQGAARPQAAGYRGQGGAKGGMLLNADTDKDGVITRAEAEKYLTTQALNRFDALDTNKDGKLSAEEQTAGRGPRR